MEVVDEDLYAKFKAMQRQEEFLDIQVRRALSKDNYNKLALFAPRPSKAITHDYNLSHYRRNT